MFPNTPSLSADHLFTFIRTVCRLSAPILTPVTTILTCATQGSALCRGLVDLVCKESKATATHLKRIQHDHNSLFRRSFRTVAHQCRSDDYNANQCSQYLLRRDYRGSYFSIRRRTLWSDVMAAIPLPTRARRSARTTNVPAT